MLPPPPVEYVIERTVDEIQDAPYGFTLIDIPLEEEDFEVFQSLRVCEFIDFNQVGNLKELPSSLSQFLKGIGPNSEELSEKASFIISSLVESIIKGAKKETAWVGVRASYHTDFYDIPRWHQDGYYYTPKSKEGPNLKFIMALKGPSTRFYPLDFSDILQKKLFLSAKGKRAALAELFPYANSIIPTNKQGAIFILGNKSITPLHSEPPIHEERIFLAVIPCKESDLVSLNKNIDSLYKNKISRTRR